MFPTHPLRPHERDWLGAVTSTSMRPSARYPGHCVAQWIATTPRCIHRLRIDRADVTGLPHRCDDNDDSLPADWEYRWSRSSATQPTCLQLRPIDRKTFEAIWRIDETARFQDWLDTQTDVLVVYAITDDGWMFGASGDATTATTATLAWTDCIETNGCEELTVPLGRVPHIALRWRSWIEADPTLHLRVIWYNGGAWLRIVLHHGDTFADRWFTVQ